MWMYIIVVPKQHGSHTGKLICLVVLSSGKWGTETSRADLDHKTFMDYAHRSQAAELLPPLLLLDLSRAFLPKPLVSKGAAPHSVNMRFTWAMIGMGNPLLHSTSWIKKPLKLLYHIFGKSLVLITVQLWMTTPLASKHIRQAQRTKTRSVWAVTWAPICLSWVKSVLTPDVCLSLPYQSRLPESYPRGLAQAYVPTGLLTVPVSKALLLRTAVLSGNISFHHRLFSPHDKEKGLKLCNKFKEKFFRKLFILSLLVTSCSVSTTGTTNLMPSFLGGKGMKEWFCDE